MVPDKLSPVSIRDSTRCLGDEDKYLLTLREL